ncbi:Ribokinase-like protein [Scenedesmus sp. NREL 46B-D3]|nr:Ribokinase-like protein [Scenedesmus sp. NREL 46B-D3]
MELSSSSSSSSSPGPRVLSIQSSVVHGYVGNKAAVFPLQLLGFDVDPVNTVQFSNHTGYPAIKGHVFDGSHLRELLAGLTANGLVCHTHLLSGYIGSLSLLEAVAAVATELRNAYPRLTYGELQFRFMCDPVLGDEGKLYVSQELVAAHKATLVPLANILTPNQFEAECLTGLDVASEAQALQAAAALHDMGDLLAALLLAWSQRYPDDLAAAVEHAVAGLQGVLQLTAAAAGPEVLASTDERSSAVFRAKELRLVQGQKLLLQPDVRIRVEPISS